MYLPEHFHETRNDELLRTIAAYPFGSLVLAGPDGFDADHLPFLVDDSGAATRLLAHVARANPLWQRAGDGAETLIIFRAGDAYVSPNWYPSKHATHRQVPTWNYRVVHVHGRLRAHDDEKFVRGVVARLTRTHETRTGAAKPWKITDSEPEFIDQMLANIVGLEVEITRMTGKWKLGQNKDGRDRVGAANALQARGEQAIADAMLDVASGERA